MPVAMIAIFIMEVVGYYYYYYIWVLYSIYRTRAYRKIGALRNLAT